MKIDVYLIAAVGILLTSGMHANDLAFMLGHSEYTIVQSFGLQPVGNSTFLSHGIVVKSDHPTVFRCPEDGIIVMIEMEDTIPPPFFLVMLWRQK